MERELLAERIKSGLENARRKGIVGGRPSKMNGEMEKKIVHLRQKNVPIQKIAKSLQVGVGTIYKVLKKTA